MRIGLFGRFRPPRPLNVIGVAPFPSKPPARQVEPVESEIRRLREAGVDRVGVLTNPIEMKEGQARGIITIETLAERSGMTPLSVYDHNASALAGFHSIIQAMLERRNPHISLEEWKLSKGMIRQDAASARPPDYEDPGPVRKRLLELIDRFDAHVGRMKPEEFIPFLRKLDAVMPLIYTMQLERNARRMGLEHVVVGLAPADELEQLNRIRGSNGIQVRRIGSAPTQDTTLDWKETLGYRLGIYRRHSKFINSLIG